MKEETEKQIVELLTASVRLAIACERIVERSDQLHDEMIWHLVGLAGFHVVSRNAARTWIAENSSACTTSMTDSRSNSRIAIKVTATPCRPSSGSNRSANPENVLALMRDRISDIRCRTERRSRCICRFENICARFSTS